MHSNKPLIYYLRFPGVAIVFVLRILGAISIIINPFWGFWLSLFFDSTDSLGCIAWAKMKRIDYHRVDKVLDIAVSFFMVMVGIKIGLFVPFLILFLFRLTGGLLFEKTRKTIYLILFPNFIWSVYFFEIILKTSFYNYIPIIVASQVFIELWLHLVVPGPLYPYLMKTRFGKLMIGE